MPRRRRHRRRDRARRGPGPGDRHDEPLREPCGGGPGAPGAGCRGGDGDGDAALRWYSEKYFLLDKECDECPIVEMSEDLKDKLDAMFSDKWEIQFKKLMKKEFDLPVKTIK